MTVKFIETIKNYFSIILSAVALIAIFVMAFMTVGIGIDTQDESLYAQLIIGFMLQLVMIVLWVPEGKKLGEQNKAYVTNRDYVSTEITKVSTPAMFTPLEKFCRFATEENIQCLIEQRCVRIGVNYPMWKQSKEYRATFGDKIAKKIKRIEAQAPKAVAPINANAITSCSNTKMKFDPRNHEKGVETGKLIIKIVFSAITTFVGATLIFAYSGDFREGLAKFLYWAIVLGSSIFFSVRTGYDLVAVVRNDYFLRMVDFFKRFHAWRETTATTK